MLHGFNILRQQYSNLSKPGGGNQSAINTIQTLADRLSKADENQLSIEDRRAAVLALKGLSRDHNRAVGEHALPALLVSLQRDVKDEDIARALIECCITLCEVQSPEAAQASAQGQAQAQKRKHQESGSPSGLQHTDIFLHEPQPLHCLLPLLAPDRAFYTRFASLQLLGSLLRNRPHKVQDHVLVAPGGCGAILECLAEGAGSSSEIVRNEALLLLPHLVYGNADIQKLVAFEGAFEKLLDVCAAEGRIEGGVVVQDALEGLEALLRYNVSNQNYFRETLSIPMLAPLLFFPPGPSNNEFTSKHAEHEYARQLEAFCFQDWDHQKVVNAKIVLDIAGLLIGGQGEGRRANQSALLQCGMTKCLLDLSLASTAPASLKAQALHVSALVMQASRANQDLLSTLLVQPIKAVHHPKPEDAGDQEGEQDQPQDTAYAASAEPSFTRLEPRPAVVCLVETAIGSSGAKGGLGLRGAAIACFRAYVRDNVDARLALIYGMAPEADGKTETETSPAGKVLLEGITQNPSSQATFESGDAYKHLVSSMLFSYLVRGSETAKAAARSIAINPDGSIIRYTRPETSGDDSDDEDEDDDAPSSLIQVIVGNLTLSERELADAVRKERATAMGATVSSKSFSAADWTRIMVGYLVLLSVWLHESPLSVRDFLSESATLQAVVQPVAQSSGVDPLIQGLAAFLLGVAYEFDTDPGKAAVTRATMHPILQSRIGADQFAVRINRVGDDVRFIEVTPDVLERLIAVEEQTETDELRAKQIAEAKAAAAAAAATAAAAASDPNKPAPDAKKEDDKEKADEEAQDKDLEVNGLGHLSKRRRAGLWFDWTFVEFWRANYTLITKSITIDPASSSAKEAALPAELLDAQRQAEALRDTVAKQAREIEVLEKRVEELTTFHAKEVEDLRTQLGAANEAIEMHAPQLEAAQTELEQLKSSHAAAVADLQAKHDALSTQLAESQAKEEEVNGKVLHLTSEMARISAGKPSQKEFAALQKTHDDLKKKHDDLIASSGSEGGSGASGVAMKDLLEARELATQRAEKIDELQAKLSTLESGASGENTATIFNADSDSAEQVKEIQAKLDAALKEKADLEASASRLAEVSGEMEKANAQVKKLQGAAREKQDLQDKVAELEKRIESPNKIDMSKDVEQAKQLKMLQNEKSELETKVKNLEKLTSEKKELETKLKDLDKVTKEKGDLEKQLRDHEKLVKEKEELEAKLRNHDKLTKDNAELVKKVKDLDKLGKERIDLEKKLKDLDKVSKEKVELEKKVKNLEKMSKDKVELEAKLKELSKVQEEKKILESKVADLDKLTTEKAELEKKVKSLETAAAAGSSAKDTGKKDGKNDKSSASSSTEELEKLKKEKEEISKENEDLLVLLEELTQKRKKDKAKLREKGEQVSEDEDDDDDDDDGEGDGDA
ncbi:related to transport protein USO1 [Melanopsichium pennsylvanicum]|uniref:Related to transport protein USO1 n=2 Tax=Melanopsichium pennsylvanicum TaxID=63383 RepID=A0AAJ5C4T5_9BASI|nr:related to transport protein USO1 [Melanopsichium pennsylvanicum]